MIYSYIRKNSVFLIKNWNNNHFFLLRWTSQHNLKWNLYHININALYVDNISSTQQLTFSDDMPCVIFPWSPQGGLYNTTVTEKLFYTSVWYSKWFLYIFSSVYFIHVGLYPFREYGCYFLCLSLFSLLLAF